MWIHAVCFATTPPPYTFINSIALAPKCFFLQCVFFLVVVVSVNLSVYGKAYWALCICIKRLKACENSLHVLIHRVLYIVSSYLPYCCCFSRFLLFVRRSQFFADVDANVVGNALYVSKMFVVNGGTFSCYYCYCFLCRRWFFFSAWIVPLYERVAVLLLVCWCHTFQHFNTRVISAAFHI